MAHRLLRTFGLLLIALPEPFTTPLGASLLAASFLLFRRQKADSYYRLQTLVKEYLSSFQPSRYASSVSVGRQPRALLLHPGEGNIHRVGLRGYARPGQSRIPVKVVHHTLNPDLWRQYRNTDSVRAGLFGCWSAQSSIKEKVVHHSFNRNLPSRVGRVAASV
jgi:hypothetical protein